MLRSLRARLLLASALAIFAALAVSGVLLARLFEQHVETRIAAELQGQLNQLAAGLETDADGKLQPVAELGDRRYAQPYSGIYWQIDPAEGPRQRSRSLWDYELALPRDELPDGSVHRHGVAGPQGATLFAVERGLTLAAPSGTMPVRIAVAVDRREIDEATSEFRTVLWRSLVVVGSSLFAAFALMLHIGLLPLQTLQRSLRRVHAGKSATVEGAFPTEIQALVEGMNRLLDQQRQSLARARERAADLAHGFKTPLSLLAAIARDLERTGAATPAQEIESQVDAMGRHVRRELARARVAGGERDDHAAVLVKPVAEKIVATMRRIGGDRDLAWSVESSADAAFAGDETDLMEMIGNLAENAGKWALSKVVVSVAVRGDRLDILVDDDGPGIPDGAGVAALQRGKRLDESAEGTGLGLSIVDKAVAAYGGEIDLSKSPLGGLRARLILPGAKLTGE